MADVLGAVRPASHLRYPDRRGEGWPPAVFRHKSHGPLILPALPLPASVILFMTPNGATPPKCVSPSISPSSEGHGYFKNIFKDRTILVVPPSSSSSGSSSNSNISSNNNNNNNNKDDDHDDEAAKNNTSNCTPP